MALIHPCAVLLIANFRLAVCIRFASHSVAPTSGDFWVQYTISHSTFSACACQTFALRVHVALSIFTPPIVIEDAGSAVFFKTARVSPVDLYFKAATRRTFYIFRALHSLATVHIFWLHRAFRPRFILCPTERREEKQDSKDGYF